MKPSVLAVKVAGSETVALRRLRVENTTFRSDCESFRLEQRIVPTIVVSGGTAVGRFVDRPEAGSYRLGMRLLELGNLVKARLNVRDAALTPMRELHKLTQQPVNLSMRQGDEIVYIERTYSERSGMQVVRAIGGRAPLQVPPGRERTRDLCHVRASGQCRFCS